jgi:hypothetical protein
MKHIHIVEPYHSVAMQYMTQPLEELKTLYEVTQGVSVETAADVNIHVPFHTMTGYQGGGKHIIAYTHCNPGAEASLLDACERADIVTAMSYEGRRELVRLGVDPAKIWVIYASQSQFQFARRLIAIVGFPQPNGRKRESLLLDLAYQYDLRHYEFLLVGTRWENVVTQLKSLGVAAQTVNADTNEAIHNLYHRVDALLVTGYIEGGPLPLLEAMASGCKVFSPRFGYAADLLMEHEIYETPADLMEKMNDYFGDAIDNAYLAHLNTWQDYAAEYALIIGRLLGESVDLYPERGLSRYAQILDVIDEVQPVQIVEAGTWKGDTALRMIQQAAKYHRMETIIYQGFDLFERQTAADFRAELSKGSWQQHIIQRRLAATKAGIALIAGYTRDTMPGMLNASADLFFIDGGHSEETIENDGQIVHSMKENAVAIFDDYYTPARAGTGCNKFIDSLDKKEFEITYLPAVTVSNDGRGIGQIQMVKVRRARNDADIPIQRWETYAGITAPHDEQPIGALSPV